MIPDTSCQEEETRGITSKFLNELEEVKADICDHYCKYPLICDTEAHLDAICAKCALGRL